MQERVLRQFIREVLMEAEFVPDWKKKEYYNMAATGLRIGKGEKEGKGSSNSKDKIFEGNDDAQTIVELIEKINNGKIYYRDDEKGIPASTLNAKRNIEEGNVPPGTKLSSFLNAIKMWMNGISGSYENIIKRSHGAKSEMTHEKVKEIKNFMVNNGGGVLSKTITEISDLFINILNKNNLEIEASGFQWFGFF